MKPVTFDMKNAVARMHSLLNISHSEIERLVETKDPELLRAVNPRTYRNTGKWGSPKAAAYTHAQALACVREDGAKVSRTMQSVYLGACLQRAFNFPCLFVESDLLEATLRTDVPDGISWMEMNMPFDAGTLVLPRGFIKSPAGTDVDFVAWTRVCKDSVVRWEPGYQAFQFPQDAFTVYTGLRERNCPIYDAELQAHITPYVPKMSAQLAMPERDSLLQMGMIPGEHGLINQLRDLVLGLFLILEYRPTLIRIGKQIKPPQPRKNRPGLYEPSVIGADYRLPRTHAGGAHAPAGYHWVPGHHQTYHIGPKREQLARRWKEPYPRNIGIDIDEQ